MAMQKTLSDISQYYDSYEFESDDTPVICSIVVPNSQVFDCLPSYPMAAKPQRGRVANGRGLTNAQCETSGLGEAVELASSCEWGDEEVFTASISELGEQAWTPSYLDGFSDRQLNERKAWNASNPEIDWRPEVCSPHQDIDWIWANEVLGANRIAIPADYALIGRREPGDERAVSIADSNGCASGPTIEDAKISAALELVERDATGLWWYGRQNARRLPLEILENSPDLLAALLDRKRQTVVFDITTDVGIPSVASVSWDVDGTGLALGFSSAFNLRDAAHSAAVEMAQIELTVRSARTADDLPQFLQKWMSVNVSDLSMLSASELNSLPLGYASMQHGNSLNWVVEQFERAACRISFMDLTRSEFDIPTFRAIAPNLCHYKPRFGKLRSLAAGISDKRVLEVGDVSPNQIFLSI